MAETSLRDTRDPGDYLRRQIDGLQRLRALLEAEFRVLGERDPEPLLGLARDKAEAAERLAGLTAEAEAHLEARGLPPGRQGWLLWIQSQPDTQRGALESLWATLVEELEAVARQNEVNGRALELRQRSTELLLDALRGTPRDTYEPRRNGGSSGHTLAEV